MPHELGDFGVLVHGGWDERQALLFDFLLALTLLLGGLVAYVASASMEVVFLGPFAAGNFIYITAADLYSRDQDWQRGETQPDSLPLLHSRDWMVAGGSITQIVRRTHLLS